MDPGLVAQRLGEQVRGHRTRRGLTQAALARLAHVPRQKVVAVEQGDERVGLFAYVRILAAMNCELAVVPARLPTLEEVEGLFE